MQAQEFPLTPAMQAVIAKDTKKQGTVLIILAVVLDVLFLGFAAFLMTQSGGLPYGIAIILLAVVISAGLYFYYRHVRRTAGNDLAGGLYRRLTGPMRTGKETQTDPEDRQTTNYYLIYGGHRQRVGKDLYDKVVNNKVSWGTIEETPNGHLIFTVRDANGQLVYHHPAYQPEEITAG